ncbi:type II secretion system F family protein [Thiorhodospira sibirica]|uniref:type II secretion system F family protein n=1 Tax=Thiorhodospira sibirica TaxID=154347 RepID=UPI00022C4690|nr:type II secretion system F family protein [Thiorhodospira sibirica]
MPRYTYKASTAEGEVTEGQLDAEALDIAVHQLHQAGLIPIRIEQAGTRWRLSAFKGGQGIKPQDIALFTRELATLLEAGLPLDRSLQLLIELTDNPRMTSLCANILERVRGGASLSDAVEAQEGVFSRFYVNMLRAGELGGSLAEVLNRLSEYLEQSKTLRDSVISAMIYPAILVGVSVISVLVLLTFVVPHFSELFDDAGQALPLSTQIVVASGEFLQGYGWLLALLTGFAVMLLGRDYRTERGRLRWDGWLLHLPLFGDLLRKLEAARFCHTLGTLIGNGVPLISALGIVKETLNNRVLGLALAEVMQGLKQGQGMAAPLLAADVFPRLGVQMIKVGEETGALESMLLQVAKIYDQEVRLAIKRMLALLEPLLIVTLGLVIAFIIISILMAIVSVNQLAF